MVSAQVPVKRKTVTDMIPHKGGEPLVMITAYTAPMAKIYDPHVDMLLVGDSVAMVVYGLDSTVPMTLDIMIAHGAAVVRGSRHAMVVIDLPFGSYQESPAQAFASSARVLKETGAAAVKLEGGVEMAETVAFLVQRGIPVVGHIGLTPQHVNTLGGFRSRGRGDEAERIRADAQAISDAGAFAIVIEGTMEPVAREITRSIPALTIGIGGSPACDGQVLVGEDMLGVFTEFKPKFVKRYAHLAEQIDAATAQYASEVRARTFPSDDYCFGVKKTSA